MLFPLEGDRMTELERMLSGKLYNAMDETLSAARNRVKKLTWRYNQMDPTDYPGRTALLGELLGHLRENSQPGFRCDYGAHITVGCQVFINYGCVFLDVAPISIGDRVLIGPRTGLYTAGHPAASCAPSLMMTGQNGRPSAGNISIPRKGSRGNLRFPHRLSIDPERQENGKEGCARGTQEGFPAPFKSTDFRTFWKF